MTKLESVSKTAIFTIFSIALFGLINWGYAATIEDLKKNIDLKNEEIRKLEEEAKKYRDEIVNKKQESKTLQGELSRLTKSITGLKNEINVTQKKVQKTELELEKTSLEIRGKEVSIKKMQNGLAGLIQGISEKDQESLAEVFLKYGALSDFFGQYDQSLNVEDKILSSLETLRDFKKELEDKKTEAEGKKEELGDLKESLEDRKKIQEVTKQERNSILKNTQNQEKKYQELLRATEKKQEEILKEIEEIEEKLRQLVDPSSLPKKRTGFLKWPTEGTVISQGYGETPFTKSRRGRTFYKFHNGIDISNSMGTPIFAADDGSVLATGDTDKYCWKGAYGKYIVIDHKNNLATMYAHLSIIKVSAGQEIKRGDIIGYMGNSGLSTGPHLHFTLYDSRTVEIRKGNVGTCGLLPFGGSINPLLYL